jgi:hypothetical protein
MNSGVRENERFAAAGLYIRMAVLGRNLGRRLSHDLHLLDTRYRLYLLVISAVGCWLLPKEGNRISRWPLIASILVAAAIGLCRINPFTEKLRDTGWVIMVIMWAWDGWSSSWPSLTFTRC